MIRYITSIVVLLLLWSCDAEKGLNCTQAAGDIVQEEFEVDYFDKILVWERVQLIIEDGLETKVVIETGNNLLNDIEVTTAADSTLVVRNNNGCNLVREYGITKVFVTSPNIKQIRNSSGEAVRSQGVLRYPKLALISEDQANEDLFHIDGDFYLDVEVDSLSLLANGLSNFYLNGTVNAGRFELADGDGRIEAENLAVQDLIIFHRSSQPMKVNPIVSIRGTIRGIGDVISVNRPVFVDVEEVYRGRLIYE